MSSSSVSPRPGGGDGRWFWRDVYHHVWWHWSRLLRPRLWRNVARWRGIITDTEQRDGDGDGVGWRRAVAAGGSLLLLPLLVLLGGVNGNVPLSSRSTTGNRTFPVAWLGAANPPREQHLLPSSSSSQQQPPSSTTVAASAAACVVVIVTTTWVVIQSAHLSTWWKALQPWRKTLGVIVDCVTKSRSRTAQSARDEFYAHCRRGRARSTPHYDLYLPPSEANNNKAILLLPGAGVGHRAYARVAHLFSNLGYHVVVVNAEPLRQILPVLGFDATYFQRHCIDAVTRQGVPPLTSWALVGHSMGGFCAAHVAVQLGIRHVVLWAAAPFVTALPDLSSPHDDDDDDPLRVAVVQGGQDIIRDWVLSDLQPPDADWTRQFWAKLPSTAVEYVIAHGTHAGFAHYTSRRFAESSVGRDDQQGRAVEWTHRFLSSSSSSSNERGDFSS